MDDLISVIPMQLTSPHLPGKCISCGDLPKLGKYVKLKAWVHVIFSIIIRAYESNRRRFAGVAHCSGNLP